MSELYKEIDNFIIKAYDHTVRVNSVDEVPKGRKSFTTPEGQIRYFTRRHGEKAPQSPKVSGQPRKKVDPTKGAFYTQDVKRLVKKYLDPESDDDTRAMIEKQFSDFGGDTEMLKATFKNPWKSWKKIALIATVIRIRVEKADLEKEIKPYLESHKVIGDPKKPILAVASSPINCHPSRDCAQFCYACLGRQYTAIITKGEVIDRAVRDDPEWVGDLIAKEFKKGRNKKLNLYKEGKALRFFDRGEGSEQWAKTIAQVNKHGIRAHVFSKRPEFLDLVDARNVRLLSIDASNPELAEGNNHPIAFVYTGEKDLPLLEKLKDRIQVVLPVQSKETKKDLKDVVASLPSWTNQHQCPVDNGKKEVGSREEYLSPKKGKWNCPDCDKGGGVGCFCNQPTAPNMFKDESGVDIKKSLNPLSMTREELSYYIISKGRKRIASQKVAKQVQLSKQINSFIKKYSI